MTSVETKDNELAEAVSCPICYERYQAEIYQCPNGHPICSACKDRLARHPRGLECPSCRDPLGNIRNRGLERAINALRQQSATAPSQQPTSVPHTRAQTLSNNLARNAAENDAGEIQQALEASVRSYEREQRALPSATVPSQQPTSIFSDAEQLRLELLRRSEAHEREREARFRSWMNERELEALRRRLDYEREQRAVPSATVPSQQPTPIFSDAEQLRLELLREARFRIWMNDAEQLRLDFLRRSQAHEREREARFRSWMNERELEALIRSWDYEREQRAVPITRTAFHSALSIPPEPLFSRWSPLSDPGGSFCGGTAGFGGGFGATSSGFGGLGALSSSLLGNNSGFGASSGSLGLGGLSSALGLGLGGSTFGQSTCGFGSGFGSLASTGSGLGLGGGGSGLFNSSLSGSFRSYGGGTSVFAGGFSGATSSGFGGIGFGEGFGATSSGFGGLSASSASLLFGASTGFGGLSASSSRLLFGASSGSLELDRQEWLGLGLGGSTFGQSTCGFGSEFGSLASTGSGLGLGGGGSGLFNSSLSGSFRSFGATSSGFGGLGASSSSLLGNNSGFGASSGSLGLGGSGSGLGLGLGGSTFGQSTCGFGSGFGSLACTGSGLGLGGSDSGLFNSSSSGGFESSMSLMDHSARSHMTSGDLPLTRPPPYLTPLGAPGLESRAFNIDSYPEPSSSMQAQRQPSAHNQLEQVDADLWPFGDKMDTRPD